MAIGEGSIRAQLHIVQRTCLLADDLLKVRLGNVVDHLGRVVQNGSVHPFVGEPADVFAVQGRDEIHPEGIISLRALGSDIVGIQAELSTDLEGPG